MSRPFNLPSFWKYLTKDRDGTISGISDDAPEKEKIKYEEWKKEEEEMRKKGWK